MEADRLCFAASEIRILWVVLLPIYTVDSREEFSVVKCFACF
jgi:hypothetical protein